MAADARQVNRLRNQFFAGTRFTCNQYRRIAVTYLRDLRQYLLHRFGADYRIGVAFQLEDLEPRWQPGLRREYFKRPRES
jgi:hypothetical protein